MLKQAALLGAVLFAIGTAQAQQPSESVPSRSQLLTEAGIRFEHAEGVVRDLTKAQQYYCAAARADHADALIRLGWMYANGRGVPRNDTIANTLFQRAAKLGSDMGERLAELVRAEGPETLPECLRPASIAAVPPNSPRSLSSPDALPTPDLGGTAAFRTMPATIERKRLLELVLKTARAHKLDPRLAFAVIATESAFDPLAKSPKGALGLMQLIPETADRFGVTDAFDVEQNLRGGMAYLRWLLAYFKGDVVLTLAGYNAGEGAVDRFKGVPPFAETVAYVQRIRALYPFDKHPFDSSVLGPRTASPGVPMQARSANEVTAIRR